MLAVSSTNYAPQKYSSQVALGLANYSPVVVGGESEVIVVEGDLSQPLTVEVGEVLSVIINDETLTPAADPESPQLGEFTWNPYSQELQIFHSQASLYPSVQLVVDVPNVAIIPPLLRGPVPPLFARLPLTGTIQLERSFEEHPAASGEFEIALEKRYIQQILAPGQEVEIYGLPLRIESLSITEIPRAIAPDMRCKVSVSFGGKWENYIEDVVFLRDDGSNRLVAEDTGEVCVAGEIVEASSTGTDRQTTVRKLLRRAGIGYYGPILKAVEISAGTPRDATANPAELLDERLRVANSFVRWSHPRGVEVVKINSTSTWFYPDSKILGEIETTYDAIDVSSKGALLFAGNYNSTVNFTDFPAIPTPKPVVTLKAELPTNLAFEYPNAELTGEFSQGEEDVSETTQGESEPRWVRKPQKRETRVDGDLEAHTIPEGTTSIEVMSLCFDLGGPTKSRQFIELEDGTEVGTTTEIWGFAYTASEIYDDARQKIVGNPAQEWKLLKQTRTDFVYDLKTGYLLYEIERGFDTVRYLKENIENPQTLELVSSDSEYSYYDFFRLPIFRRTSRYLQIFDEYSISDEIDWVKRCNRQGKPFLQPVYSPDLAPPYYARRERNESGGYRRIANPENEGLGSTDKRKPDLVVGEESIFETRTKVTPAVHVEKFVEGEPYVYRGQELIPQKFYTYNYNYKTQGQGIGEALEESSTTEGIGDPEVAKRRENRYFKKEEKNPQNKANEATEPQCRYLLQSPGYSAADPIGGSESFPVAQTLTEAITAARTKFIIENWKEGLQETLQIPGNLRIKEGDRFNYVCNGEFRRRVVLEVSHDLEILGDIGGERRILITTSLTLGKHDPNWTNMVSYSKHRIPEASQEKPSGIAYFVWSKNIGEILPLNTQTRRNP